MSAERLYEMWKRPSDPPWHKLPYYDHVAKREFNCFGKEHFHQMARKET